MATHPAVADMTQQFSNFVSTCSPSQLSELTQAIQRVTSQNAQQFTTPRVSIMALNSRVKRGKEKNKTGGAKRPLNSFMAFRNYYGPALAPHTQKDISGIIKVMWSTDPFKAKWVMLGKAYSVLRSTRTRAEVPLEGFFALCAPIIGIIPPNEYQDVMGWDIGPPRVAGEENKEAAPQVMRLFVPDIAVMPEKYTTTTLSVDDLVQHCYDTGYATPTGQIGPNNNNTGALTMAVQPAPLNEGENTLLTATETLRNMNVAYPFNTAFDPTTQFDVTFNPVSTEEGGAWDAFDPNVMGVGTENSNIDWTTFFNDEPQHNDSFV